MQRRNFIKAAVFGAAAIPAAILRQARAAESMPMVDTKDPIAVALGYVADAAKVDTAANPIYKAGQKCATCVQYQGKATDKQAVCPLFAGKQVYGAGWCKVWVQKAGA